MYNENTYISYGFEFKRSIGSDFAHCCSYKQGFIIYSTVAVMLVFLLLDFNRVGVQINYFIDEFHCVKNVQIRSFFLFVFSCIRTEYGPEFSRSV